MTIKYLSEHHSPDDPGGLIKEVLEMGAAFPGPAEDIVLAWMLRLEDGRDPAEVAARLMEAYGIADGDLPEGACGRVVDILRQTAAFGSERLKSHLTKPKRRGGRRRRG
jgi:hypothetical protein